MTMGTQGSRPTCSAFELNFTNKTRKCRLEIWNSTLGILIPSVEFAKSQFTEDLMRFCVVMGTYFVAYFVMESISGKKDLV